MKQFYKHLLSILSFSLFLTTNVDAQFIITQDNKTLNMKNVEPAEYQRLKKAGQIVSIRNQANTLQLPVDAVKQKNAENLNNIAIPMFNRNPIPEDKTRKTKTYNPSQSQRNTGFCEAFIPSDATFVHPPGLVYGDDAPSSNLVAIPFNFCFYGTIYNSFYVNNNGNITFVNDQTSYTATGFPDGPGGDKMIAPFWGDVDTDSQLTPLGTVTMKISATHAIIVWTEVGYYAAQGDKRNTFEVIISDGIDPIIPGNNNVSFRYLDMQWTTGSASCGTANTCTYNSTNYACGGSSGFCGVPATVGVNQGDGVTFFQFGRFDHPGTDYDGPGSLTQPDGVDWLDNQIFDFDICNALNIKPVINIYDLMGVPLRQCDTIYTCVDDSVRVTFQALSPEVGQTTTVNITSPGSTGFSVISNVPGNISLTTFQVNGLASSPSIDTIYVTATDDGTPIQSTTMQFIVKVNNVFPLVPTLMAADTSICQGDTIVFHVNPATLMVGDIFSWYRNGVFLNYGPDSLIVTTAGNYTCKVTRDGCSKTSPPRTVVVYNDPTPPVVSQHYACAASQAKIYTTNPGSYVTYSWNTITGGPFINGLGNDTIYANPGSYTVLVTDTNGCSGTSPLAIIYPMPAVVATYYTMPPTTPEAGICLGDSIHLDAVFGNGIASTCGINTTSQCIATTDQTVGTGTGQTGQFSFPSTTPFLAGDGDGRVQYLYLASELNAAGFVGGLISKISFNVLSKFSGVSYDNFTISLACTNLSSFNTANYVTSGLNMVYTTPAYNSTLGWNTFDFSSDFDWDGVSNLIVQVCYNNPNFTFDSNDEVEFTTTGFNSVLVDVNSIGIGCNLNAPNLNDERPNIRFSTCRVIPDIATFKYNWTPLGTISFPAIRSPKALPSNPFTYTVTVRDTISGCLVTDNVPVNFISQKDATINPAGPFCFNAPNFTLSAIDAGGIWSGPGIVNAALGIFDPSVAGIGTHIIKDSIPGSCGDVDTMFVTVLQDFNFDVTPSTFTGCLYENFQATLSADPGNNPTFTYTYNWSPTAGVSNTTTYNPVITLVSPGTTKYYATTTNQFGCSTLDSITVISSTNPAPTANAEYQSVLPAPPGQNICLGDSVHLSVSLEPFPAPTCNYTLSVFDAGFNGWDGANLEIVQNGITVGIYSCGTIPGNNSIFSIPLNFGSTVQIMYSPGTTENENAFQFLDPSGAVIASQNMGFGGVITPGIVFSMTTNCFGASVPANTSDYTYAWTATPSGGIANSTMMNTGALPTNPTSYSVQVTDKVGGCSVTETVNINFIPNFTLTTITHKAFCATDAPDTLRTIEGGGIWKGPGIVNATFGVFDPQTVLPGTYIITDSIPGNCGVTDTTLVTVLPGMIFNLTQNVVPGCTNYVIDFQTTAAPGNAPAPYTYQWTPSTFLNATNTANVTANINIAGPYNYSVTITNTDGCSYSGRIGGNVVLETMPSLTPTESSNGAGICEGTSVNLGVTLGNIVPNTCDYTLLVSDAVDNIWNNGGHLEVSVNGAPPTSYSCTGVSPLLNTVSLPHGANVTLTYVPGTANYENSYTWSAPGAILQTATLSTANGVLYTGTVNCAALSAPANPANYTYQWSSVPASTIANSTSQNTAATPTLNPPSNNTIYTVNVFSNSGNCSDDVTIPVLVNPNVISSLQYSQTQFCSGTNTGVLIPTVGSSGGTFSVLPILTAPDFIPGTHTNGGTVGNFNPNNLSAGSYTISYTVNGCGGGTAEVKMNVIQTVATNISYSNKAYCLGGTSIANLSPAGGTLTISPTDAGINSVTGDFSSSVPAGTYIITYSAGVTCSGEDKDTVVISSPVTSTFSYGGPFCYRSNPNPVPLMAAGASARDFTANSSNLKFVTGEKGTIDLMLSEAGEYEVKNTVPPNGSCPGSETTVKVIISRVVNEYTVDPLNGEEALLVNVNVVKPDQGTNYTWSFGDGSASFGGISTTHTFDVFGNYIVELRGTNQYGCEDVDTSLVSVSAKPPSLIIPNVFTPNDDKSNDVFRIDGDHNLKTLNVEIFDRWGKKVGEITAPGESWDGAGMEDGVYFYLLSGTTRAGDPVTQQHIQKDKGIFPRGYFTLMR